MTMSTTSTSMASTTSTTVPEAEAYLAAVRHELDDLSEEERADLLEDLALHLGELSSPANRDEDSPPLQVRLGPPADYAAELRSAAWRHPWAGEARAFLPELRPAWWVLRGYLVVAVPALWSADRFDDFPVPTVLGSSVVGAVAVIAAVVVSVRLARRRLSLRSQLAFRGLEALVVLGALALLSDAGTRLSTDHSHLYGPPAGAGYELNSPHGPVTNIYPYGRDGSALEDVLLFDQDGRPLRTAHQEWWPDGCQRAVDHSRAADGVAVEFSYPKRYVVVDRPPMTSCTATAGPPPVPLPEFPPPPPLPEQPAQGPANQF